MTDTPSNSGPLRADPCVNICVKDEASDICLGCGRLGAEIAIWSDLSAAEQQSIIAAAPDRLKALADARRARRRGRPGNRTGNRTGTRTADDRQSRPLTPEA